MRLIFPYSGLFMIWESFQLYPLTDIPDHEKLARLQAVRQQPPGGFQVKPKILDLGYANLRYDLLKRAPRQASALAA
jgi:hypothetical protein